MQRLMSHMRAAIDKYGMISDGDRIAVGVSGGKDSVALLFALDGLRRFYPEKFELVAISLDPCFGGVETDYSALTERCEQAGIKHVIRRTQLWEIIFNIRKESNPCSLCARMRRGILHEMTQSEGCNKIALGHTLDDAVQTFFMNLLDGGRAECFAPVTYLSRRDITMIRPMVFADENEVIRAVNSAELPIVKSACPVDGNTERERAKLLVDELEKQFGSVKEKTIGALEKAGINGWHTDPEKE